MITILGRTNFRTERRLFGIRHADRRAHMYLIGATGTGKSTLIENMIRQDMAAGEGLCLLDPHGDLAERVRTAAPDSRQDDLIYLDVADLKQPYSFNPLVGVPVDKRPVTASGILEVFQKVWIDSWGPRLEHLLRNALFALLDQPAGATFADILRLLDEDDYRREVARHTQSQTVRRFWLREFDAYPERLRREVILPVQNKVGAFLTNPFSGRLLAGAGKPINLRAVMDTGKMLIVNLARGRLGVDTTALVGALLATSIASAAFSRVDVPEDHRADFWFYLDEFPIFATNSFTSMLAELRKYRVGLTLSHQHLSQLSTDVRDAVLGNVGSLMAFRLGPSDSAVMVSRFAPAVTTGDLTSLLNHRAYVRLLVEGHPIEPFSAVTCR